MNAHKGSESTPLTIVGLGASAGGLEALTATLAGFDSLDGLVLVIAQHTSPEYESLLPSLLTKASHLQVSAATSGQRLASGSVLVIPPGFDGVVENQRIVLKKSSRNSAPHPSANALFASIAQEFGARSIGIVLSGTGSDGSIGAREIKARGGFVIVQTPETAKYDGMPNSTIAATAVDLILAPSDIGPAIPGLLKSSLLKPISDPAILKAASANDLFDALKAKYQIDFRQYKASTISRRFSRRIVATGSEDLDTYNQYVRENPSELKLLYQDLIISVTSFFRDPEIYSSIRPYLAALLKNKAPGDEIRVWVPGCASGEEAYSLAIMINQLLGSYSQSYRLQIFATDIDQSALAIARKGYYEAYNLKDVDKETLSTYFQPLGAGHTVKGFIQDQILFAHHNLTMDPPFLHLDLVSCRNVMIYFTNELQEKVLEMFHYGLNPKGLLLLGKSEGLAGSTCFESTDHKAKLFRKIPGSRSKAIKSYAERRSELPSTAPTVYKPSSPVSLEERVRLAISNHIIDRGFVIDATLEIRYVYGDLSAIAQVARGKPSNHLQSMIAPQFQSEIKNLIYRLRSSRTAARSAPVHHEDNLIFFEGVTISLPDDVDADLFFIRFQQQSIDASKLNYSENDSSAVLHLQHELSTNREHLQTAMEELQTSNEELQSLNEEMQSSNEELQSTNEELETANEELQSSNEELMTVNEEMQAKSEQLNKLNGDLLNLQNSLPHPLLVVDRDFVITHHNVACHELFQYEYGLQGQRLHTLMTEYSLPDLMSLIKDATEGHQETHAQIEGSNKYWLTITPYKDSDGTSNGAVLIFWNNTDLLDTHKRLQNTLMRTNLQGKALEAAQQGITIADATQPSMPLIYANAAFTTITGYTKEEVFGRNCRFLQGKGTSPGTRERLGMALNKGEKFSGQLINYRKDGSEFYNRLELSPIYESGKLTHYVGIQTDISDLVQSEKDSAFSRSVFDNTQESILILKDDQRVQYANPAATRQFSLPLKELKDQCLQDKVSLTTPKSHHSFNSIWRTVKKQNRWQGQLALQTHGETFVLLVSINRVHSPDNIEPHYVMLASDITQLKKRETELKHLATIDPLTNLPNRTLFRDRLKEAVARGSRSNSRFALMFLDMDNFKRINDTMGHKAGDLVLKYLAKTVGGMIRENDTFARISGDEFVLILDSLSQPSDAHQFAQRIIDEISRPYQLESGDILLSASVGVAIYPEDGENADVLMRNADLAMYRAKQRGKAQVGFVDPERSGVLWEQIRMETALRKGLVEGEDVGLHLNFQPIYSATNTATLDGFEALLRWDHPELGQLSPDQFLPSARSAGFSKQLDLWVFHRFLKHYAEWHEKYPWVHRLRFAINIDPGNMSLLTRSQISALLATLDDEVNRPRLSLEITEHGLIDHDDELRFGLDSLQAMDVMISIDDFGSGYSNFVYITDLASIRQIKLDRSIVSEIDTNPDKLKRLRAIIKMLKEIGYHIAVEGIESQAQLELLEGAGHDCLQGFHLSRPLTAEQTETLIMTVAEAVTETETETNAGHEAANAPSIADDSA